MNRFTEQWGIKRLFEKFITTNSFVSDKLRHAIMKQGTLKAYPLPLGSFPGKRCHSNVLLTCDAASFIDPVTGEGIYYALKSGILAAQAAVKAMGMDEMQASRYYEKLWRKEFWFHEFQVGYLLQSLLTNSFFMESLMRIASKKQSRVDMLANVIGHMMKKIELLKLISPFI